MELETSDFRGKIEKKEHMIEGGLYISQFIKKIVTSSLLCFTLAVAGGDVAPVEQEISVSEPASSWEQSITIYGWVPSFDGTLKYTIPGDGGGDAETDWLDKIDLFIMANYEVRKDKWSFLMDMIYLNMSDSQQTSIIGDLVPVTSEEELTGWLLSFYGGYNILEREKMTLDVIAGLRYFSLELDIDGTFGSLPFSVSPSTELYDMVVGMKGKVDIDENWYVPYLFDIGGGDSDLTWQASAGIGYHFDWGDLLLTYRYVYYDKGDEYLIQELDMYGPKVGVVFHF